MEHVTLNTEASPEIVIDSVGGDLRLVGWDRSAVEAEADAPRSLDAKDEGGSIRITAAGDCAVRVPRLARLRIGQVRGDARLKSLEGAVEVREVGGDLVLRQAHEVSVGQVGGQVRAKKLSGPLSLRSVHGDASARGVAGDFTAQAVGGDLYLREAGAAVVAQRVGGDIALNVAFHPEHAHELQAGGDLLCRLLPDVSATLTVESGGDISVEVPGAQVEEDAGRKVVILGEGAARVRLRAGGDVTLTGPAADSETLGEFGEEFGVMAEELAAQIESQVESQIELQMADFQKQISDRLRTLDSFFGADPGKAQEITARARRAAERASQKLQRKAAALQRKVERRAAAAQRRAERDVERARRGGAAGWKVVSPAGWAPGPSAPPGEPVSDDERLAILRMVEQGKISVDQAETLLAALEGEA